MKSTTVFNSNILSRLILYKMRMESHQHMHVNYKKLLYAMMSDAPELFENVNIKVKDFGTITKVYNVYDNKHKFPKFSYSIIAEVENYHKPQYGIVNGHRAKIRQTPLTKTHTVYAGTLPMKAVHNMFRIFMKQYKPLKHMFNSFRVYDKIQDLAGRLHIYKEVSPNVDLYIRYKLWLDGYMMNNTTCGKIIEDIANFSDNEVIIDSRIRTLAPYLYKIYVHPYNNLLHYTDDMCAEKKAFVPTSKVRQLIANLMMRKFIKQYKYIFNIVNSRNDLFAIYYQAYIPNVEHKREAEVNKQVINDCITELSKKQQSYILDRDCNLVIKDSKLESVEIIAVNFDEEHFFHRHNFKELNIEIKDINDIQLFNKFLYNKNFYIGYKDERLVMSSIFNLFNSELYKLINFLSKYNSESASENAD